MKKSIVIISKFTSVILLVLATLLTMYSSGYFTSLLLSFVVQYSVVAMGLVFIFVILKNWKYTAVNSVTFILFFLFYIPYTGGDFSTGEADFSIAHFNVLKYNRVFDKTIKQAKNTDAEILSFQEVDSVWAEKLQNALADEYPYSMVIPREDCYGLALFSKLALSSMKVADNYGFPIIEGNIDTPKNKVSFVCIHTRAPLGRDNFDLRNNQIEQLSKDVKTLKGAKLVIGDFNSVPWDTAIKNFKTKTALFDSRKKITPTYPSHLPIAGIPIDFIFHSKEIKCLSFESLKGSNSDHFGVYGKYSLDAL